MIYTKGILFDLGDTLLHDAAFEPEKGDELLFPMAKNPDGVTYRELRRYAERMVNELHDRREASQIEHPCVSFMRTLYEYHNLELPMSYEDAELLFSKASNNLVPAPGIVNVLQKLTDGNIPLGVVSNSAFSGRALKQELEQHGMLKYFKFLISSSDYGVRKPNPLIFELAAAKLRIPASDICFIGNDREADYRGSRGAGMVPLLYTGKTGIVPGDCENVLRRWEELEGMISI